MNVFTTRRNWKTAMPYYSLKKQDKNKGLTLVELLVAAAVISIVTGIGFAYYTNFDQNQKVLQAAKQLVNNLKRIQSNAASGVVDTSKCDSEDTLDGWYADIDENEYYGICNKAGGGTEEFPDSGYRQALVGKSPSDTSFSLSGVDEIKFNPLYGNTTLGGEVTIIVSADGITKEVTVTPEGTIRLND